MKISPTVHRALAAALLLVAASAAAQGTDSTDAVNKIIGSPVTEEKANARADPKKLVAAIEQTPQAIAAVRKTSDLKQVEIVYLEDASESPPPDVAAKLKEREADVTALRKELEGNAMLFHAIDSRQILLRDVLAVTFEGDQKAIIYAAAKAP